ncbi:hypothetical protein RB653_005446 [Dictyostelium firmibasis]|uniref:Uncharacterized protein n=1 Tax=Dictyostelium firmibasis TaxID=79012 RepID=A0AAN7U194_9MYCE
MNKFLLTFAALAIIFSPITAQKAFAIWNDATTNFATVGIIDLNTANSTANFVNTGFYFTSNTTETYNSTGATSSTYNPATGLISYIATEASSGIVHLNTVDTNTWKLFNSSKVMNMNLGNLAYDQTADPYNIFATITTGDGYLYVTKLSASDSNYKVIDKIPNVYPNATGTFIANNNYYAVCFVNSTGLTNCNYYTLDGVVVNRYNYQATGVAYPWVPFSAPYMLTYLPQQKATLCLVFLQNKSYADFYGRYQFFWLSSNSQLVDTYWSLQLVGKHYYGSLFGDFSLPRVYQFVMDGSDPNPYMQTYSTYNNQWVKTQKANNFVLNAWGFV